MNQQQEAELLAAFRVFSPKTKELVMIFMRGQAGREAANKPRLKLIVNKPSKQ